MNMRITANVKAGFSLIEILFAVFIMVLSIGMALTLLGDTKSIDEVEAATRLIAVTIKETQNNSLSGTQQLEGGSLFNICSNSVEWKGNVGNNTLFGVFSYKSAPPAACSLANGRINVKSETFKKVKLDPAPAVDATISFMVPAGDVTTSGFALIGGTTPNSAEIKVTSVTDSSVFSLVCVYPNGRVDEVFGMANCP